jgi:hypothetical protein
MVGVSTSAGPEGDIKIQPQRPVRPRPKKPRPLEFFCAVCEHVFRVRRRETMQPGKRYTVACPTCGRKARVVVNTNGDAEIEHGDRIYVCPRPLRHNPLVTVLCLLVAAILLTAVFTFAGMKLGLMLCPVVLFFVIVAMVLIGAVFLQLTGQLDKRYIDLVRIVFKALPNVFLNRAAESEPVEDAPGQPSVPTAPTAGK